MRIKTWISLGDHILPTKENMQAKTTYPLKVINDLKGKILI
jgi:hypothetical protein